MADLIVKLHLSKSDRIFKLLSSKKAVQKIVIMYNELADSNKLQHKPKATFSPLEVSTTLSE